jgi:DNA-binding CsgD family transcriptional regulator
MLETDEQWLAVADAFYDAAFDHDRWYPALESLAQATGSSHGELITLGPGTPGPIHIFTNMQPGMLEAFDAMGGADPRINPRVKAGNEVPNLTVLAEEDFITPDEHKRNPHYQEFARPWNIPYICLSPLERTPDLLIGLAVTRSERQGHITKQQRRIFASIAPHVRASVRTQLALENNGPKLLAGAFEALSIAAFICDARGLVRALTPSAETLVGAGRALQLQSGQLRAAQAEDTRALQDAIDLVTARLSSPARPPTRTVLIRGRDESDPPTVLDVLPLPGRQCEISFSARALIVVRGTRDTNARKAAILSSVYALTPAEVDITLQLAAGKPAEVIAKQRSVAIGTVRAQIKNILAKVGMSRQIELVAHLGQL